MSETIISPSGFREYDARWLYPNDVNKKGLEVFGYSLGQYICKRVKVGASVVVGHDYRSYSEEVKYHVVKGLLSAGCNIIDIGLSLSPMVYFAQHHLNTDSLAMITASHNDNGWTGIKCGIEKSLTFGPNEMREIKELALSNDNYQAKEQGKYEFINDLKDHYLHYLIKDFKFDVLIVFALGCIFGLLLFSRFLSYLFLNYKDYVLSLLSGFLFGSLLKVWPFKTIIETRINSDGIKEAFVTRPASVSYTHLTLPTNREV